MRKIVLRSKSVSPSGILFIVLLFCYAFNSSAQNLEFIDLGVVEGEFKSYNRSLTWTNESPDSLQVHLWSSDAKLKFTPLTRFIQGGEMLEIPIKIALPSDAGDLTYELRLLDENDLVLHGFQMNLKVLQSELDVFKAYRNVHFPLRTKQEVFNLKSGQRGDTLSAVFDVYNLGGSKISTENLIAGDSVKVSFSSKEIQHHAFAKMTVDLMSNDQSELGFQKRIIKLYENDKLIVALPVQYTILPSAKRFTENPKLSASITSHDFKTVKVGDKKEVSILLTNQGADPLLIEKMESNCDCLEYDKIERIEAGSAKTLSVVFDATNRIGLERKTIAIFSNDPSRPVLVLSFRAHVK